jgi:intracellular multiplication protein IcmC
MSMLIALGTVMPSLIMLMQGVAIAAGVWLTIDGMLEVWGANNDNLKKHVSGTRSYSTAGGLIQILIGGILLSFGTLEFVGVLSRTFTGDYAAARMTADSLSYTPGASSTVQEKAQAVVMALLALLQAVGFTAMFKGFFSLNRYFKQHGQAAPFSVSITWIIAGMFAWNFKWVSDVINNTIGFNFISLFASLK